MRFLKTATGNKQERRNEYPKQDDSGPANFVSCPLCNPFGSGAGSDSFDITVTDKILERRDKALKTQDYIARRVEIDYATYARYRGKITMK